MSLSILVRHAESVMNTQPHLIGGRSNHAELTELGNAQSKLAADYLHGYLSIYASRVRTFSSIAKRAYRTIDSVHQNLGLLTNDIVIDDRLQELSQGVAEGKPRESMYTPEVLAQISRELKDFKFDSGESMNDVTNRMHDVLYEHATIHPRDIRLYGTHGFAIRCLVAKYNNWSHSDIRVKEVPNTAITVIDYSDVDKPEVLIFALDPAFPDIAAEKTLREILRQYYSG